MKRNLYLSLILLCVALVGYGQGSQINSTVQVYSPAYYGVYGTLTFNSGYIITDRTNPNSNVYFTTGSASAGEKDASHINGYAEKEGTTAFTFPIGDGTTLRPAGFSTPAASARFQAAYFKTDPNAATQPSGAPFPTANLGTGVSQVSTVEYWDINGATGTNLTLTWNAASNLNTLTGGDITKLIIVGYNPTTSKWESLGAAGGTTGTLAATGSITANGITPNTYNAYTFGKAGVSGLPDLNPTIDINSLNFASAGTSRDFVVHISEVGGLGGTTAPISFAVSKVSAFTITYSTTSGTSAVLGTTPNQNSNWTFTETASYIILTSKAGVTIPTNGDAVIGFTITRNAGVSPSTTQNITATIAAGTGGGETPTNNNAVVRSVTAL